MSKSQAGRLGGLSTFNKYGRSYMREIGKRGAVAFWKKYRLVPVGVSNFAIVNRQTNVIVGTMLTWRM